MTINGFFFGRKQNLNNGHRASCGKYRCGTVRTRNLSLEPLESRDLLSVGANFLDADDAAYVSSAALPSEADSLSVDFPTANEQTALQSSYATPSGYNHNDYQKMVAFLEQTDESGVKNGKKISSSYNPSDPSTWDGFYWTYGDNRRITHILIAGNQLVGTADFSDFTSLQAFNCYNNKITSLSFSGCTALTFVNCSSNQLTNLNVLGCSALIDLYCFGNQLSSLSLSSCTALARLGCYSNQLSTLNVSSCKELTELDCDSNQLGSLNVSNCNKLETLLCSSNNLTTLNVSGLTSLTSLSCYYNQLTSLNVSGCTSLTEFSISYSSLNSLDASGCTSLTTLSCNNNQLTSLNVSNCSSLRVLNCSNNNLATLKTTGCTSLGEINCSNNQLSSMDLSSRASLTKLNCSYNPLGSVNMSGYSSLTELDCSSCNLNSLDISPLTKLTKLYCYSNQLSTLTLTGNTLLTELNCGGNNLQSLDVVRLKALTKLDCRSNQLTSLNVSQCTLLTELLTNYNQLTELDLSKNTALTSLFCGDNNLTELNVSKNINLTEFDCSINSLTELDLSKNTLLSFVNFGFNSLTVMDLSNCTKLESLVFYNTTIQNIALPTNRSNTLVIHFYTEKFWTFKNSVGTVLQSGLNYDKSFDLSTTTDLPLCAEFETRASVLFTSRIIISPDNTAVSPTLINRNLYIPGTPNDDWVEIEENAQNLVVRLYNAQGNNQLNSWSFGVNSVDSILFWGYAGNDVFKNWSHVTNQYASKDVLAYGGDGNDVLIGGSGNDFLLGGEGNDYIDGADGDNRIVTGNGLDTTANTGNGSNLFIWMGSQDSKSWSSGSVLGDDDVLLLALPYSSIASDNLVEAWTENELKDLLDESNPDGLYPYYIRCGNWKAIAIPRNNSISEILCGTYYLHNPSKNRSYNYGSGVYLDRKGSFAAIHEFGHFWNNTYNPYWESFYTISWDYDYYSGYTFKSGCVTDKNSPYFEFTDAYGTNSPLEDWAQCVQAVVCNYENVPVGNGGQKINRKFAIVENFLDWVSENYNDFNAPTNLRVSEKEPTSISLGWDRVSGAPGYTVLYSASSDFTNASSIPATSNSATITGLNANTTYYFKVMALGNDVHTNSSYSPTYSVQTLMPGKLASPTLSAAVTGFDSVSVTVGSVAHAASYSLEYSLNSNFSNATTVQNVQPGVTTISGLNRNATYYFRVRAIGTGAYSNSEYSSTSINVKLPLTASVQNRSVSHTPSSGMAASVEQLTDWDDCYIELWTPGVNSLNSGQTTYTFSYNPDIYSAPSVTSCSNGVSMNLSQRTQLPNGNVQYTLTIQVSKTISSQTNNLYLGTIVLTPLTGENAGIEDGQNPKPVCALNGSDLSTTVQSMSFDLVHDNVIDVNDFIEFATVFGCNTNNMSQDNPNYKNATKSDFDKNGIVDVADFVAFAMYFGRSKKNESSPIPLPSESSILPVKNEEVEKVESEIQNEEFIISQNETLQSAFDAHNSLPINKALLINEDKVESSMELREAYSASLLDLYDNQNRSYLLDVSDVLTESGTETPVSNCVDDDSQKKFNDAVDAVLEDDLLAIYWEN